MRTEPFRRRRVLGEAWKRNLDELLEDGGIDLVCFTDFLWTLGNVAMRSGALDRALSVAREKGTLDQERQTPREEALAAGLRADILQARGQLDEALRIRQEEELPVFERLGDVRSRAVTLFKVASIFQAQGKRDEALGMLQQQVRCFPSSSAWALHGSEKPRSGKSLNSSEPVNPEFIVDPSLGLRVGWGYGSLPPWTVRPRPRTEGQAGAGCRMRPAPTCMLVIQVRSRRRRQQTPPDSRSTSLGLWTAAEIR